MAGLNANASADGPESTVPSTEGPAAPSHRGHAFWFFFSAVTIISLLMCLGLLKTLDSFRQQNRGEAHRDRSERLALQLKSAIFDKYTGAVGSLSQKPLISHAIVEFSETRQDILAEVLDTVHELCNADTLLLMDDSGEVLACHGKAATELRGRNLSDRPYFQEAMSGKVKVYPAMGSVTGELGLFISAAVRPSPDGDIQGVTVMKMNTRRVEEQLAGYDQPALLATPEGVVLATNRPQWRLTRLHSDCENCGSDDPEVTAGQFGGDHLDAFPLNVHADTVEYEGGRYEIREVPLTMPDGEVWKLYCFDDVNASASLSMTQKAFIGGGFALVGLLFLVALGLGLMRNRLNVLVNERTAQLQRANEDLQNSVENLQYLRRSRAYLAAIIETTEDIAVVKDLDLRVVASNHAFRKAAGCEQLEDLLGKTDREIFGDHVDPELINGYMSDDRAAQRLPAGEMICKEDTVVYPDGSHRTFLTRKFPVFDEHGRLMATANLASDITDRKYVETQMEAAKKQWERTFDAVPDMIAIIDDNYRIVRANRALARNLGVDVRELMGKTCHDYMHAMECPPDFCPMRRLLEDGQEHECEYHDPTTGRTYWVTVSSIHNSKGEFKGAVHLVRDVTSRRQAEEKLRESVQELEQFNRLAVGREMRMIELKEEVNALAAKAHVEPPYDLSFVDSAGQEDTDS